MTVYPYQQIIPVCEIATRLSITKSQTIMIGQAGPGVYTKMSATSNWKMYLRLTLTTTIASSACPPPIIQDERHMEKD